MMYVNVKEGVIPVKCKCKRRSKRRSYSC